MSQEHESKAAARRKLLKRLAAGGGVVATGHLFSQQWARPIVESVVLPAHAQATNVTINVGMSPQFSTFNDKA